MAEPEAEVARVPSSRGCNLHLSVLHSCGVSRVIQIRDVPDDVHDALREAAAARGLSLNKYMLRELEQLARRAQVVHDNAAIIRETQRRVRGGVDRSTILAALHEGRGE